MEQEEMNKPEEINEPKEMLDEEVVEQSEMVETEPTTCDCDNDNPESDQGGKCCRRWHCIARLIFDLLMLAAVITLFVLYGKDKCKGGKKTAVVPETEQAVPGNGDILYVNIDTLNANYEMVNILTDSLQAEQKKKEVVFQNRQKALETKLRNYQNNLQTGQLNAQQAQYAEAALQQENQQLQSDYEQAMSSFEARYAAALSQIADSLKAATKRINEAHNASFIITYGGGSNLIVADPTKDITNEVLEELNKPFKKKK